MIHRGFNLEPGGWEPSLLAKWNCHFVRFGMPLEFNRINTDALDWFLGALDRDNYPCQVVPVLFAQTYGKMPNGLDDQIFYNRTFFTWVRDYWEKLAERYKGHPRIWAFDIYNEPSHRVMQGRWIKWNQAATRLIKAIRDVDSDRRIVVEPLHGDISELNKLKVKAPKLVYSPHMYAPTTYTHQGIIKFGTNNPVAFKTIEKRAKRTLDTLKRWAKENKAKILIGEFSAVRWADGADKYLDMCVRYFEAREWSWCYHTLENPAASLNPPFPEQPWNLEANALSKEVISRALI